MIVRSFLEWTRSAPAAARAEGTAALVDAYLGDEIHPDERADAVWTLTALLDDPSPLVRLAMARRLAPSPRAPHHLVTALANDRADIAAVVLEASPLLGEAELVDILAIGCGVVQVAVARRQVLPRGAAAALAEVGRVEACLALCRNANAALGDPMLARLIERFGHDAALRAAILARPGLHPGLRHDLVLATAAALARFATDCGWLSPDRVARISREAQDQACLTIAAQASAALDRSESLARLIAHLRGAGRITPALLLRALLCGNHGFFAAAVSDLSGLPPGRVAGILASGQPLGFAALYARAGLPASLAPAFQAALADAADPNADHDGAAALQHRRVIRVLAACERAAGNNLGGVMALLRRFAAEAACAQAKQFARTVRRTTSDRGTAIPLPRPTAADLRTAA